MAGSDDTNTKDQAGQEEEQPPPPTTAPPSEGNLIAEGLLRKRGKVNKSLKTRHFRVFDNGRVEYREDAESTKLKGQFNLQDEDGVEIVVDSKKDAKPILIKTSERNWWLEVDTTTLDDEDDEDEAETVRSEWLTALLQASVNPEWLKLASKGQKMTKYSQAAGKPAQKTVKVTEKLVTWGSHEAKFKRIKAVNHGTEHSPTLQNALKDESEEEQAKCWSIAMEDRTVDFKAETAEEAASWAKNLRQYAGLGQAIKRVAVMQKIARMAAACGVSSAVFLVMLKNSPQEIAAQAKFGGVKMATMMKTLQSPDFSMDCLDLDLPDFSLGDFSVPEFSKPEFSMPNISDLSLDSLKVKGPWTRAIKRILRKTVDKGLKTATSCTDWSENELLKISMPALIADRLETLRKLGLGKKVQDMEDGLNKIGPKLAKAAQHVFKDLVDKIDITDARKILSDKNGISTMFKEKCSAPLMAAMEGTARTILGSRKKLSSTWNIVVSRYNLIPMLESVESDLAKFVTSGVTDSLMNVFKEQEKRIRG